MRKAPTVTGEIFRDGSGGLAAVESPAVQHSHLDLIHLAQANPCVSYGTLPLVSRLHGSSSPELRSFTVIPKAGNARTLAGEEDGDISREFSVMLSYST